MAELVKKRLEAFSDACGLLEVRLHLWPLRSGLVIGCAPPLGVVGHVSAVETQVQVRRHEPGLVDESLPRGAREYLEELIGARSGSTVKVLISVR